SCGSARRESLATVGRPAFVSKVNRSTFFVLLRCKGRRSSKTRDTTRFCLHDGTQSLVQLLDLVEAPRERRDGIGDAQERQGKGVTLVLVRFERLRGANTNSARQQLRVAKRVSDSVRRQWILKITRIAHQGPTRSLAVAQIAPRSTEAA